tara:strand:- start:3422 stop:3631 length:210 start_codon:yes stop_codon:yes gene_type:complete
MSNKETGGFDFLLTLKESTAQIVDSALKAFDESIRTLDWNKLDSDEQRSVKGWHVDLQKAKKSINEGNG